MTEYSEVNTAPDHSLRNVLFAVVGGIVLALIINTFFMKTYTIPSSSMENTLQVGDYVVSIPLLEDTENIERGNIITFTQPEWDESNPETVYVKRVIGVAGDTLTQNPDTGEVIVNGETLDEPYLKSDTPITGFEFTVPDGKLIVMGDNRHDSYDSRKQPNPFVDVENVQAKPLYVSWPWSHLKFLQK